MHNIEAEISREIAALNTAIGAVTALMLGVREDANGGRYVTGSDIITRKVEEVQAHMEALNALYEEVDGI